MLSKNFAYYMQKYGAFDPVEQVSASDLESYRGRLPESLLTLWAECGRGAWLNGIFQFCDPARYHSVLDLIFDDDPDFSSEDCLPYGYTAFGRLLVWSQRHQAVEIDLRYGWVTAPKLGEKDRHPDDLVIAISTLSTLDRGATDMIDDNEQPLFDRAVENLGRLALGQVYGFFPALAVGGSVSIDKLKRVGALAHFSILAQLTSFALMDFSSWPLRRVRDIG